MEPLTPVSSLPSSAVESPVLDPTDDEKRARALSPDTLKRAVDIFVQQGAVALKDVFDVSRIDALRRHFVETYQRDFDDRSRRRAENVGDRRNLVVVEVEGVMNDPETYANPMVHPLLKRLLGDDCIVGQYGSVTSLPGAADQRPHRDSPWLFGDPAIDLSLPTYAITVVIPLVDMRVDHAGTTRVWPATHHIASDEEAAAVPHADPVLPKGSCLLMDCRLRHGGTGNRSTAPRPLLYMSYQRRWFRDYDGYQLKPPLHISEAEFTRIPREYRQMFAWARADNTPETIQLAIKRALKRVIPERVKAVLRR